MSQKNQCNRTLYNWVCRRCVFIFRQNTSYRVTFIFQNLLFLHWYWLSFLIAIFTPFIGNRINMTLWHVQWVERYTYQHDDYVTCMTWLCSHLRTHRSQTWICWSTMRILFPDLDSSQSSLNFGFTFRILTALRARWFLCSILDIDSSHSSLISVIYWFILLLLVLETVRYWQLS